MLWLIKNLQHFQTKPLHRTRDFSVAMAALWNLFFVILRSEGNIQFYHHLNFFLLSLPPSFHNTSIHYVLFQLGQFTDDRHCSRLRTLLCHYPATQVSVKGHVLGLPKKYFLGNLTVLSNRKGIGVIVITQENGETVSSLMLHNFCMIVYSGFTANSVFIQ